MQLFWREIQQYPFRLKKAYTPWLSSLASWDLSEQQQKKTQCAMIYAYSSSKSRYNLKIEKYYTA